MVRRGSCRNQLAIHVDLTYEHKWTPKQLILWDNRCLLHRATDYDSFNQARVVRRCTVLGEAPVGKGNPGSASLDNRAT